jgi:hypothetical protein
MKKPNPKSKSEVPAEPELNDKKIFEDLEIPQRTQAPPSAELIARLNELASKPPFSFVHKARKHEPR